MSENDNSFPFEIKDVELNQEYKSHFSAKDGSFVRVGPKGYLLPKKYEREALLYYNMPVRPSDVFVVGVPRSGTRVTEELVWLLGNDLDYKKAADLSLERRFPWLEPSIHLCSDLMEAWLEEFKGNEEIKKVIASYLTPATEWLSEAPSPRFIKTHLPLSLLPPALLRTRTARVVYVARDPRDVAVSFYHLSQVVRTSEFKGDFKTYWNYTVNDLIIYMPFFEHVKEGWERRHNQNVLFLFYDELSKDMPATIHKVAKFLDKPITDEQVVELTDHLRIENFKTKESVNGEFWKDIGYIKSGELGLVRKGKVGGWREHFSEEMTQQAKSWIANNLRGSDLRFPGMDDQ